MKGRFTMNGLYDLWNDQEKQPFLVWIALSIVLLSSQSRRILTFISTLWGRLFLRLVILRRNAAATEHGTGQGTVTGLFIHPGMRIV